ncbi:nuclear receptor 2C2-associated protein isoform X2 [Ascaphus truei]|uniref:nuclear receptor 2C2-associated protein isoform X2 n=1 Tax=Ascaphus truei TaxID=8439 RepID=UPI003F59CEFE
MRLRFAIVSGSANEFHDKMAVSVVCGGIVSRVSSVLNRDVKQFGKKYLFDRKEDTCWNSDQGASQWILLEFPQCVCVSQLHIQFQGGFSSKTCTLEGCPNDKEFVKLSDFYPEDTNALQKFSVPNLSVDKLKISFQNSTDFFGRIIVYHLDILGQK